MVALQSTNRVKISKVRETTFGVTPATPAFKTIRQTSSALAINPKTVVSNEIRSDRQVSDLILVGLDAGGTVGGEMSFQTMDDDMEEALQGAWSNNPNQIVTALTTTTATVAAGSTFNAGMLVLASGFATSANNAATFVVASSTSTSVVFPISSFIAEATPPATASIRVVGFQGASGDLVAVTAGGNKITSTTLDFTTLGLVPGQWIRPNGFATISNNDFCRVSAIAAHILSLDRVPSGWVADTGSAVVVSIYVGDFLINGTTLRSNTIERQYLDQSPVTYEYLTGQTLDQFSIDASAQKIATYIKTYIGASGLTQTSRFAGATDIAAATSGVLNTAANVGRIGFDGSNITGPNYVMAAKLDIKNNLRRQAAVGSISAIGIGNGEFTVSGSLDTYFGDKTVLDKIINNTLTSFDIRLGKTDANKDALLFDFPSIKLSAGSPSVSGKNADVHLTASFQAILSATYGYTMSISRFWFLP